MNAKLFPLLVLGASLFTIPVLADNPAPATTPTSVPAQTMVADQIIYAPQLPSVAELIKMAAAQGLTVRQIVQSDRAVSITYQLANGQSKTISYQLLANAVTASAPVVATTPAPTTTRVVYVAPDYYYDPFYYPYYGPYWYPPVSVRLGFGFRGRGWGFRGGHR